MEWNIHDAYIKNSKGERIVDFQQSNLHVVNYSSPVKALLSLNDLKPHLHTLPDYPQWLPYLTSYYKEDWGFCVSFEQYKNLHDDVYEVLIDSSLTKGALSYGELYIEGKLPSEYLFTCYLCHPSMCNDGLSGVVLLTSLAQYLLQHKTLHSYRFLFIPETIGALTWLALNEDKITQIRGGIIATCVGDGGMSTYKKTRKEGSFIDAVVEKVLLDSGQPFKMIDFSPWGSDERQFSSPGFNLEMGSLMRTPYGCYPEYHTSADNLDFMSVDGLSDSFKKYCDVIHILENNKVFASLNPKGEPQLSKRGLYSTLGSRKNADYLEEAIFWVLNLADGQHSLLDLAKRSKLKFKEIQEAAQILYTHNLLTIVDSFGHKLIEEKSQKKCRCDNI
jgi:aminopeptidase-like protein